MGKKILVIDDSEDLRKSLCDLLGMLGYEVLQAADGLDGIEIVERIGLNLVISDLNMPHLDGRETLIYIKAHHPATPVIMVSGDASPEKLEEEFLLLGADAFFAKPYNPRDLLAKVKELLGE